MVCRSSSIIVALVLIPALAGCGGQIETGESAPHPEPAPAAATPADPSPAGAPAPGSWAPIAGGARSLTNVEYVKSVRDLLGADVPLPIFDRDDIVGGYTTIAARSLAPSTNETDRHAEAATAVARRVAGDSRRRAELAGCQPTGPADAACADRFVRRFGRLAWRRPLSDAEAQRYTRLLVNAGTKLDDFWAGMELALGGLLQSPFFLYRFELGAPARDMPGARALDGYELATRLSYALLNTTPSPALLDAAERGELGTPDGLRRHAEKLLSEPRVTTELSRFFDEWLHLERLASVERSTSTFTPKLREVMREETLRSLRDLAFERDGDFRDAMTSRETFVNAELAKLYGLPAPAGDAAAYIKVALPPGPRAGLFGQASFLTINAEAARPSAVLRGKAVNESFLCTEVPQPSPDLEAMFPPPSKAPMPARKQLEIHRANPACAPCHNRLDPPGLAFENFDQLGRYREKDGTFVIDASGELDGMRFRDAAEFGAGIREHPGFAACVVRQLFRYTVGAMEESGQEPRVEALRGRFQEAGYGLEGLVLALLTDPVFRFVGEPR